MAVSALDGIEGFEVDFLSRLSLRMNGDCGGSWGAHRHLSRSSLY